ncbi:MAG: OHCU decarboxylase [Rhizobiales bacterium]|nr:OHCU decarboxylase [Hyphomicrobiales bacterium]MBA67721.1 OHCU decarboxylase [Hyphomicrobiales bacterium]
MTREEFVDRFGDVFEHSPWIAERAWDHDRISEPLTSTGVHEAMCAEFRAASRRARTEVLRAHPDLAGRLALANQLTASSKAEQAGAGLDRLTPDEHARFTELNDRYMETFGFPFIIAVRGHDKHSILEAFEDRVTHTLDEEFEVACAQVERIADFRITDLVNGDTA